MTTPRTVVVVGYGVAGASAAVAAHDAGARVVVLESTSAGGGNALYSGGFLFDLPEDRIVEHLDALCFGRTPREVLESYAGGIRELRKRLPELGVDVCDFVPPPGRFPAALPAWPGFPGGHEISYFMASAGEGRSGAALWQGLDAAVRSRDIETRLSTSVNRLSLRDDGTVTGVVLADGSEVAASSVVLTCGGFEGDPGLADAFLPLPVFPIGHAADDGAGVRMGLQAGASLWHMYAFFGWFALRVPEYAAPFALDLFGPSFVWLDADGRRFADETGAEAHDRLRMLTSYLPRNPNKPALPTWVIFDEATRLAGPLNGLLGTPNEYVWSADNAAEIERGWIRSGDSVAELAGATGLDEHVLDQSLTRYNDHAAAGRDADFGREPETLVPLDLTRLYAVPTWPGVAGTVGGPRHDARARVLRPDGSAIAGLYAAGAVSLVYGYLIDFGGGLTDALVFGRIAGEEAAGAFR